MFPRGSSATFDVVGDSDFLTNGVLTADQLRADVLNILGGTFDVPAFNIALPSYFSTNYTATITVTARADYGQPEDAGAIVANAFYQVTGSLPTVAIDSTVIDSALPAVTSPGPTAEITTGLQSLLVGVENAITGLGAAMGKGLGNAAAPAVNLSMFAIVALLGLVAIVVFSPTGREVGKGIKVLA